MGSCSSCFRSAKRGESAPRAPSPARGGVTEYSKRGHDELVRFYSLDRDESRLVSCTSFEEPAEMQDSQHEPVAAPRRVIRCGRTGEFYGFRDRIPSHVDVDTHDDEYWWSGANLEKPAISKDMGLRPTVLSRPIKVTVVPSAFFASHRDIEVFPEYLGLCMSAKETSGGTETASTTTASAHVGPRATSGSTRLIIFKLKMAEQVMVSLNEVMDGAKFDEIFSLDRRDELLHKKLKLILSPINSPLPIPAKKPHEAETIGAYFGMDNVDLYLDESLGEVKVASVLVNIYSKWVIRKFLPLVTASRGRICDFILLSSDDKIVFADFRLLATEVSQALIRGK